jgi:hypothetical protein
VGGYWPIRSEVDSRPLMEALLDRGQDVALSQIIHPHLSWRLWRPGDVLIKGGFGVREPGPDAPEVFPSALLVPLVAFDRRGGASATARGISTGPSRPSKRSIRLDHRPGLCGSGDRRGSGRAPRPDARRYHHGSRTHPDQAAIRDLSCVFSFSATSSGGRAATR